jgi:hypothetical protein
MVSYCTLEENRLDSLPREEKIGGSDNFMVCKNLKKFKKEKSFV